MEDKEATIREISEFLVNKVLLGESFQSVPISQISKMEDKEATSKEISESLVNQVVIIAKPPYVKRIVDTFGQTLETLEDAVRILNIVAKRGTKWTKYTNMHMAEYDDMQTLIKKYQLKDDDNGDPNTITPNRVEGTFPHFMTHLLKTLNLPPKVPTLLPAAYRFYGAGPIIKEDLRKERDEGWIDGCVPEVKEALEMHFQWCMDFSELVKSRRTAKNVRKLWNFSFTRYNYSIAYLCAGEKMELMRALLREEEIEKRLRRRIWRLREEKRRLGEEKRRLRGEIEEEEGRLRRRLREEIEEEEKRLREEMEKRLDRLREEIDEEEKRLKKLRGEIEEEKKRLRKRVTERRLGKRRDLWYY